MMDYGVIGSRVDALYASSARTLGEPGVLDLVVDGAPAYAWPADQRHVWKPQSQGRFTSLIEFLTRPPRGSRGLLQLPASERQQGLPRSRSSREENELSLHALDCAGRWVVAQRRAKRDMTSWAC
jgi:hypothetical protein